MGGLVICAKKNVCYKLTFLMPTQGPSSKFGFCPRGLIHSVCYSSSLVCSYVLSLSPREGASGGVLLFSWFGEERNGNACCVWVWGARSLNFSGFLAKNQRFLAKIPQILKRVPVMVEVERATWEISCRNCDRTKPGEVIPESPPNGFLISRAVYGFTPILIRILEVQIWTLTSKFLVI